MKIEKTNFKNEVVTDYTDKNGKTIARVISSGDSLAEIEEVVFKNHLQQQSIKIERKWAMPNKWTFTIQPIKELLSEEVIKGIWVDPYCGQNGSKYAAVTNDLSQGGMDGVEFLKKQESNSFDGVLLDPPYSLRQVSEHYKKAGIKVTGWHTSAGNTSALKNEAGRVIKKGGKVICFGWNTMGLGKNRGFEMTRILLVPHGGSKNDTIVTVEIKK
jgi:hypothetical protein